MGQCLGQEGFTLLDRIPHRGDPTEFPNVSDLVRTWAKGADKESGSGLSPDPDSVSTLIFDFQVFGTVRNPFISYPVSGIFWYSSPNRLRWGVKLM